MSQPRIIQQKIKSETGQLSIRKYLIGNFLGKGGFARCYQATQIQTQQQVAIKIINKDTLLKSRAKQKLLSQIKIHRALTHSYIVQFKSVFEDDNNVYIVLELCTGRSLSEMVKKRRHLTCEETRYFLVQLLSALEYLHENKVIHRDLKMANIFLSGTMDLKLGDFGLSAKLEFCQERKRTMAGTPNYIAPEIIDGTSGHSYEVDLWSTGVICYALLFGRPPFETSELKMTYAKIKNCEYIFPSDIHAPSSAYDFIKKTLVVDPRKRMTIAQMLEHPFLKGSRPKAMPLYATQQIPIFTTNDLISSYESPTQSQINSTKTSCSPSKLQNVLKISTHINKLSILHSASPSAKTTRSPSPQAWIPPLNIDLGVTVIAHVDYSTKYGLGFCLSNGCIGVYFNDSTILAHHEKSSKFLFVDNPAHNDYPIVYAQACLPQDHDISKKKLLMNKFKSHLLQQVSKSPQQPRHEPTQNIFVKQWLKTKHAIMFRLSNRIFQVDFFDHSQILLRTDTKQIRFRSKKGQTEYLLLGQALNENLRDTELGRRIKYTKEILNSLKKNPSNNEQELKAG